MLIIPDGLETLMRRRKFCSAFGVACIVSLSLILKYTNYRILIYQFRHFFGYALYVGQLNSITVLKLEG